MKLGNNRWESAKFNDRLQVTELALGTSNGDGSLWKLGYEYGELSANGTVDTAKNTGNIAKQTLSFNGLTNPLVQTFKYDSLYRLTEARETNGTGTSAPQTWKQSFGYDRYGNRTGLEKYVGTTQIVNDNKTHPTIDPNTNRFNSGQGIFYDKNGNIIQDVGDQDAVRTFVFNGENKQRFVVQAGKTIGEYFYDGVGNRVKKVVYEPNTTTVKEETIFVYSAGKLVEEYSTKAPPQNPTTSYTATDQLGSPRVITDSNGNVVSRRDFMPFGEEITNNIGERDPNNTNLKYSVADGIRQKFTGYQKDEETGLDFAKARMYENRHGRFTAVDPLLASGKSANPQTFNRYVYVGNNPITRIDPSGKDWIVTTSGDKDGVITYRDVYGKKLKTLLASGKYERVKFNGDYLQVIAYRLGEDAGVYRMNATGGGRWIRNFAEEKNKQEESERSAEEGGMNDKAVAFGNGFSKNYETNMWLLQKMIDMNFAIIGGLGTGLGGGLTTIGNPVANSGRFASWFYRGAENDLAWSQLSRTEKFFYELGQKTLSPENYAKFAQMNPVSRGKALWEAQGSRSLISEGTGWALGAGRTLSTGPTPLFRSLVMNPAVRLPAIFGATQAIPNEQNTNIFNQGVTYYKKEDK